MPREKQAIIIRASSSITASETIMPPRKKQKSGPLGWLDACFAKHCFITWFYLSFGCIFRTVLGMTIWRNVLFWFSPTYQPQTVHGAARPRALGHGFKLALVLSRWNFSLFCMSWLVLPPASARFYTCTLAQMHALFPLCK